MDLAEALINDGFDPATAATILELAHGRSIKDATELLNNVLGKESQVLTAYIAQRRENDLQKLNAKINRQNVTLKLEKQKDKPKATKYSTAQKTDAVKDIEAAVQRLSRGKADRKPCNCMGLKHGLLDDAPNCLNCGRIICKLEGLGPCLTCNSPLLPNEQVEQILNVLREKKDIIMATMSKKALVAAGIDPSSKPDIKTMFESTAEAERHLEKTLGFQAEDAVRTRIVDQASDVDVVTAGTNIWSTPAEQAEQMRQQQRKLRILQEKEKAAMGRGRKVLSIDIRGNKIYQVERDLSLDELKAEAETELNLRDEENINQTNNNDEDEDTKFIQYYEPNQFDNLKEIAISNKSDATAEGGFDAANSSSNNSKLMHTEPDLKIIRDKNEILKV